MTPEQAEASRNAGHVDDASPPTASRPDDASPPTASRPDDALRPNVSRPDDASPPTERRRNDMSSSAQAWQDDTPRHPLLSVHAQPPLIETMVSKVMRAPQGVVFAHFFGSEPRLRLDLHKDHVKGYSIRQETADTLDYEFVFEAYGTRNWGRAIEVAHRPGRIDVEVTDGPLKGQTITTLLEDVGDHAGPATKVTQVNRVWPGSNDRLVRLLEGKVRSRLTALAGVHLEQHRADIEGEDRFQDRFSREHQARLAAAKANPVTDLLKTSRAVALPTILLPIVGAAALAAGQGVFDSLVLAVALLGGGAALLGANLLNDLYDFKAGADQSARQVPGAIETGSGAFVEGRWSIRKGWAATVALFSLALACGIYLAWISTWQVLLLAVAGAVISYTYVGPPVPLAYKGRGLGELVIFLAFGILPVAGALLAFGGRIDALALWVGAVFGLASVLMLFHHHFLHWEADLAASKMSPVALLRPARAAWLGMALALATSATVLAGPWVAARAVPWYLLLAALPPLLLLPPLLRVATGASSTNDMVNIAKAAFGAMSLTGLTFAVTLWVWV